MPRLALLSLARLIADRVFAFARLSREGPLAVYKHQNSDPCFHLVTNARGENNTAEIRAYKGRRKSIVLVYAVFKLKICNFCRVQVVSSNRV